MHKAMTASDVDNLRDELEKRAEDGFRKKHGRNPPPRPAEIYDGEVPEEEELGVGEAGGAPGPMSDQELDDHDEMEQLRGGLLTAEEKAALEETREVLQRELDDLEGAIDSNRDQDIGGGEDPDASKRDTVGARIADIDDLLETYD